MRCGKPLLAPSLAHALTIALMLSAACAIHRGPTFDVRVLALAARAEPGPLSFTLASMTPQMRDSMSLHPSVTEIIRSSLQRAGMNEAGRGAQADVLVRIETGIYVARYERVMERVPLYRDVQGQSTTTQVHVGFDEQGRPIYSTVVTPGPTRQEYVGERERCVTVVYYEKRLRIVAIADAADNGGALSGAIWSVAVSTVDPSDKLRNYTAMLASTAAQYFGESSGSAIDVTVNTKGLPVKSKQTPAAEKGAVTSRNSAKSPATESIAYRMACPAM